MKTKKTKEMNNFVEIPEGIEIVVEGSNIIVKKGSEQLEKDFSRIPIKEDKNKIIFDSGKRMRKHEKKLIGTYVAHLKNMIKGIEEKFTYKLKICSVHFPMNVSVDKNSSELIIKNFLGERKPRKAKILDKVEVNIKGEEIIVESHNKEGAGQTAANFEKITKVRSRDRRIFQDGIFITEKPGRKI